MPSNSHASVPTAKPERYIKQLSSHFGQKVEVSERDGQTVLAFGMGECVLSAGTSSIEMTASSPTPEDLERLEGVVGGHLERFGTRDELHVSWTRDQG